MQHRRLNGWQRLVLLPVLLLAVLLLVLASSFAFRGTAHAQSGATATFTMASTATLIARTTLQISVTASCTIPVGVILIESDGSVTISQASGRQIVQASGGFFSLTCDGTAQTLQLFLTPPAGSAPFHGGPATASGGFGVFWFDPSTGTNGAVDAGVNNQIISIKG
jgi:hypothetical protein